MSDTPRTDDAAFDFVEGIGMDWRDIVSAGFARQLERELAQARTDYSAMRDAARWCWIRAHGSAPWAETDGTWDIPEQMDADADAAIAAQPTSPQTAP